MWARIHLIPALQAEEDRDQVRRYLADQAREKELLGSNTKVYNSDRQATTTKLGNFSLTVTPQIRPANVCYHTRGAAQIESKEIEKEKYGPNCTCRTGPARWHPEYFTTRIHTLFCLHT
jgi:hypothetical protein